MAAATAVRNITAGMKENDPNEWVTSVDDELKVSSDTIVGEDESTPSKRREIGKIFDVLGYLAGKTLSFCNMAKSINWYH